MEGGILSTAVDALVNLWNWAGHQDGRAALLAGAGTWFGVERAWGLLSAPFSKIMGIVGLLAVLGLGGAFLADGKGIVAQGAVPFEKSVRTPNVDVLRKVQE